MNVADARTPVSLCPKEYSRVSARELLLAVT